MFWRLTAFVRRNLIVLCLVSLLATAVIVFSWQNRTSYSRDGDFAVTTDMEMDLKYPKKVGGDGSDQLSTTREVPRTVRGTSVAKKYRYKRSAGLSFFGRGHDASFTAEIPEFHGQSRFLRLVSQKLKDEYQAAGVEFAAFDWSLVYDGIQSGTSVLRYWDQNIVLDVVQLSPRTVSLLETHYQYAGGAHGNAYFTGRCFVEDNGQVHELALDELFDPESDWEKRLLVLCLADLRSQAASHIPPEMIDDESESHALAADDLRSFTLSAEGLRFYFSPYHVGSFAEGMYNVRIPYSVVIDCIPKSSPARLFMDRDHD